MELRVVEIRHKEVPDGRERLRRVLGVLLPKSLALPSNPAEDAVESVPPQRQEAEDG